MGVYKERGQWRYRKTVTLPNGTSERISGTSQITTKASAEELLREHMDVLLRPDRHTEQDRVRFGVGYVRSRGPKKKIPIAVSGSSPVAPAPGGFEAFALEFLRTHPPAENKHSTGVYREMHIRVHLIPHFGSKPLHEIDNLLLTQLVAHLRSKRCAPRYKRENKGRERARVPGRRGWFTGQDKRLKYNSDGKALSATTIRGIMSTLHTVLAKAADWGRLQSLPKFPKVKAPPQTYDWLRKAESERLLAAVDNADDRALIMFALKTGARQGEQLAIEKGDVDFKAEKITFRRNTSVEKTTKTGTERTVDMAPSLKGALQAVKHLRSEKLFCAVDGKPFTADQVTNRLHYWLRRAGLRQIRWQDLRHTFASQLATAGAPIKYIQEALGHTSIATTMRYAHLCPSVGKAQIAKLDEASLD